MRIGRTRCSAAGLLAALCLAVLFAAAPLAAPGQVSLAVKQVFTAAGTPPSASFRYSLTPARASNPMPEGGGAQGYSFTITGTEEKILTFTFTQPGEYIYTLRHTTQPLPGYTYDQAVYTLKILVAAQGPALILIYNESGEKEAAIRYEHAYAERPKTTVPVPTTVPTTVPFTVPPAVSVPAVPPVPPLPGGPKTGDDAQAALYIVLLCAAGFAALGSAAYLLRERGKHEA